MSLTGDDIPVCQAKIDLGAPPRLTRARHDD